MTISNFNYSRYLYINLRPWPKDYENLIRSVTAPPPCGSKMDRYVLDLGRMAFVSQQCHNQNALVPSDAAYHGPICVTKHLVASGHESGNSAAIWDRHHGVPVASLSQHSDQINAIAINPVDESMAVTVSDDMTLRIWRSKMARKIT